MRYLFGFLCVCALGMMPLVGCSETSGDGGSGGTAGDGGSGGVGGQAGHGGRGGMGGTVETAAFIITTWEWDPEGGEIAGPLEGVEVCDFDTANCVVSDDRGAAFLQMPVEQDIMVSVKKAGRGPILGVDMIPADELIYTSFFPTPESRLAAAYERVGFSYPLKEGTGTVILAIDPQLAETKPGATFELLGTNARAYYTDPDGNYNPDLTATSTAGQGRFFEVDPGEYQIRVGGTAENCIVWRGWDSDSANTIRFPVRAGYSTALRMWCD